MKVDKVMIEFWVDSVTRRLASGPCYLEISTVIDVIDCTGNGDMGYVLEEYPQEHPTDGFAVDCFKELCSDEDLIAYKEEVKKLFPELFPKILEPCS